MEQQVVIPGGRSATLRPAGEADLPAAKALLTRLDLPTDGLAEWWSHFVVAETAGELVALAGIERYADGVLLRSVAVDPAWRGSGLGRRVVERVLEEALQSGAADAWLLTTTAENYFPRLGFTVVSRAAVPESVQASVEFQGACPSTAIVMHRSLESRGPTS